MGIVVGAIESHAPKFIQRIDSVLIYINKKTKYGKPLKVASILYCSSMGVLKS